MAGYPQTRTFLTKVARSIIGACPALALGALAELSEAAPAATAPTTIKVANWSGGALFRGATKQFDRCSATSSNSNGMAVTYSMDHRLRWQLGISNPEWAFTNGFSLGINLDLDGRPFRGRAVVYANSAFQIAVEDPIAFFATLRISAQLRATAGGLKIEFDLTNGSEALAAVTECVLRHVAGSNIGLIKNPGAKSNAEPVGARSDAAHQEVVGLANTIKTFSNMRSFRIGRAADSMPEAMAAAGWTAESATGAVMLLSPREAPTMREAASRAIRYEQRRCRGEYFFATDTDAQNQREIARVYVACKMPESTAIIYYTTVPRPGGGAYVVTSASGQGFAMVLQRQTEAADGKLRVGILEALRRLDLGQAEAMPDKAAGGGANPVPAR